MIRVLLLIPTLEESGAEKQLVLLATGLPREEFDVRVIALTRGGPLEETLHKAGIPVSVLGKRWKFDPVTLWRLRRQVADFQPDILHAWLFAANAYGRLIAGGKTSPKVLVSERCVDSWKQPWQLRLDRRLVERTTRLIGNSQAVADFYRRQGFPAERIEVIPNGIELSPESRVQSGTWRAESGERRGERGEGNANSYPQSSIRNPETEIECAKENQKSRSELLAEFQIPPDAKVVAYVGRLARQKRLRDLIWAMQLLRQVTGPVYFLVIGDGPQRRDLEDFARKMTCDHLTRFLGHRSDVPWILPHTDVFWLASDFEGLSNSMMEAMAAGVPVVASDIPPNRELVVDGETGYLVDVGDSVGFAQFTKRLLENPALACRLGQAGRQLMQENFSVTRMVQRHARLYRDVLGHHPP